VRGAISDGRPYRDNNRWQLFGSEFGLSEDQAKLNHWRDLRPARFDENQQRFPEG
jgi:hypothetical protein